MKRGMFHVLIFSPFVFLFFTNLQAEHVGYYIRIEGSSACVDPSLQPLFNTFSSINSDLCVRTLIQHDEVELDQRLHTKSADALSFEYQMGEVCYSQGMIY